MLGNPHRSSSRLLALWIANVFGLIVVGGCGDGAANTPPPREPLHVVATTYAMADIVRAVGGDRVRVEWWVESGQSLAELSDTPQRRQQVNNVDLIVTRGQADPWTLGGIGNAYQDQRILRLDTFATAQELDPAHYIWLDPLVARDLADELGRRLGVLDPANASMFRTNADGFQHEVTALWESRVSALYRRGGGGPFVTLDRAFLPLARRFGLEDVRIVNVDLREPTPFNVKQIREATRAAGGDAIFASAEMPAPLLREWELRLSMPVLALDPLGTSARTGHSTYLQLLRYNLEQLQKGMESAKPRERSSGPAPIGAVMDSRPEDQPTAPPEPTETPDTTQPASTTPKAPVPAPAPTSPLVAPRPRSSFERVPLNIPKPTLPGEPARPASRPAPAVK
jgi:ABC-type Zn uptake system ZnuABC Zn-binding protein ZnuA